jgi:DNA polymerase-3 subunit alpha
MDGYALPDEHVKRVAELGMSALALTEHGNVSSHVKHEIACNEYGVKPIFGLEAYLGPADMKETQNQRKWHQTTLAMDQDGLRNLYQLVTLSWAEGFYRWPTITWPMLEKHHEGLIITSGCADGKVACDLLGGKGLDPEDASEERALRTAFAFREVFGDRFYLEVQRFWRLERTCRINAVYQRWAEQYGFPLLASSDVHYPYPNQNEMQKILHAAGRNTGTVAAAEAEWEYDILLTYPQTDKEIFEDLKSTGLSSRNASIAIDNTALVADRCTVTLPKMERLRYPGSQEDLLPWT